MGINLSLELSYGIFLPCLAAIIVGSIWLSKSLHEFSTRFNILPGLMGLITALGADSPEITSAVTALVAGETEVGVGVVLGSNLFNLAALMGLSPFLAGDIGLKRPVILFNGIVSLLVTGIAAVLVLQLLSPSACMILLGVIFSIYVLILWIHTPEAKRLPLPGPASNALARIVGDVHQHADKRDSEKEDSSSLHRPWVLGSIITGSLISIIIGSIFIVHATLKIAVAHAIPKSLVGALGLAALTGLPNAYTSARLALRRKGAAVVSETLNSNTINIIVGIGIPALVFGIQGVKQVAIMEMWWLLGLTAFALLLPAITGGLTRKTGAAVIALYFAFVAMRIYLP
jgi:cation:H+ antiporter